jgi:hypothetical protein
MPFPFQKLKSEEAFIHKNLTSTFFHVCFNFNIIIIVTESLWSLASSKVSYSLPYLKPSFRTSSVQEFWYSGPHELLSQFRSSSYTYCFWPGVNGEINLPSGEIPLSSCNCKLPNFRYHKIWLNWWVPPAVFWHLVKSAFNVVVWRFSKKE